MIAQLFHLTATERKTLLVAGAAAGMSATFATPVAAVLLAVELLLFEWKPRSFIPVALASVTCGCGPRRYILGVGPLFPVPAHPIFIGPEGLLGCVVARPSYASVRFPSFSRWPFMPPKISSLKFLSTGCGGRQSADW